VVDARMVALGPVARNSACVDRIDDCS
jgi:hypothetical protein